MKYYISLCIGLLIMSCTQTPDTPPLTESLAKKKIRINQSEAQKAKDAYLKLQQQRDKE